MTDACSVCRHPDLKAIDRSLSAGMTEREVAAQFGLNKSSVHRHSAFHVKTRANATAGARTHALMSRRGWLRLLRKAERAGDLTMAARALSEIDKADRLRAVAAGASKASSVDEIELKRANVMAVREALGFRDGVGPAFKSNEERDAELCEQLRAAAERYANSPEFLAGAARCLAVLLGVTLPPAIEAEVRAVEEGAHVDHGLVSNDKAAAATPGGTGSDAGTETGDGGAGPTAGG